MTIPANAESASAVFAHSTTCRRRNLGCTASSHMPYLAGVNWGIPVWCASADAVTMTDATYDRGNGRRDEWHGITTASFWSRWRYSRRRMRDALLFGAQRARRTADERLGKVFAGIAIAAVLCAGCVGWSFVQNMLEKQKAEQQKQQRQEQQYEQPMTKSAQPPKNGETAKNPQ